MASGYSVAGLNAAINGAVGLGTGAANTLYVEAFNGDPASGGSSVSNRVGSLFAAASNGERQGAQVTLTVSASSTIDYIGIYTAASAGTLVYAYDVSPNEVYASAGTATVTPKLTFTN